jgi:fumarate reductase (CoM/CoB) subunit A
VHAVDTDVLIIGGGLGALRCAYDALKAGARVAIVVKGRAGRSGSSAKTSAGYSSVISPEDSTTRHHEDMLEGGRRIGNPRLARIVAEEAPARLKELVDFGAPLAVQDGSAQIHPSGDHSIPRTAVAQNFIGLDFTQPLLTAITRLGCRFVERTAALDLVVEQGEVRGAICLSYARAVEEFVCWAPAVVLATGGAGRIFSITSNTNDVTGDGYALALRAGASLRDMEFIQFYPWRCIVPFDKSRMPIQPSTFVLGGRLYNSERVRFMESYDPVRLEATTRDVAARGIYDQIRSGKDVRGGVVLDVSDLTQEDWARSNPKPHTYFMSRGMNFRDVEMILSPEAHFFMGGVTVDEHGESEVEGLFAIGETAGGVHGANRLDSQAIPETQVFGARAGQAAARRALAHAPTRSSLARRHIPTLGTEAEDGRERQSVERLRRQLQTTMWEKMGIVRDEDRLEAALAEVQKLRSQLHDISAGGARGLLAWAELENSLMVAEACIRSALLRTESRGAHYRLDFPATDDEHWIRATNLRLDEDGHQRVTTMDVE